MEFTWKCLLILCLLLCNLTLADNNYKKVQKISQLRELYEKMVHEEEETSHNENNNPTNTKTNNAHVIEELLHPQLSWKPRKKVSIYDTIIKQLWDKILLLGNDRRRIIKLRRYIMKKLNITDMSQQEYFSLTTPSGVKESGEEEIEKRGKDSIALGPCRMKGNFYTVKGFKRRQLCTECVVYNTNKERLPKLLIEHKCGNIDKNKIAKCIDEYGSCKQNYLTINVLKKTNFSYKDNDGEVIETWSVSKEPVKIRSSCGCRLDEEKLANYFPKRLT